MAISNDPIGFAAGDPNLARYVGNHSTYASDPSGLKEPISVSTLDREEFEKQNAQATHRWYRNKYDKWHYGVGSNEEIYRLLGFDPSTVTTRLYFTGGKKVSGTVY